MGDRDIDRLRYRYIEGDLIEEAGLQKGNKKEGREPRYRYIEGDLIEETGKRKGNKKEGREPRYRQIEKSIDRTGSRYIEISRNRYIEGIKKRIKQTINNKQHYKTILC